MKKAVLVFLVNFILCSFSYSQGTIRGKVTDENGETLIGVTIVLKTDMSKGTTTDLDGNYSFKITAATPQVLVVSYISFQTVEELVNPLNEEVLIKNFVLPSAAKSLIEVEVVSKQIKAKEYYMENIKKKSATTIDYVSSETMKKTGDNNVTAAIARVSGVSTNGSFITVRGIGDRYVKTTINGAQIPTLDPFTNNIKLDLFPASLVDNIVITKTASPDLPGDWTAAYISVDTKDYPEEMAVNIETTIGYNNQTSFKNVLANQTSTTDWLGYDKNFRDRDHNSFVNVNVQPTQYQELAAIGLADFYKAMGVTQSWAEGTSAGETYFKLGLVELGLLSPALFNDPIAVTNAKNAYLNGPYKDDAYRIINANAASSGKSFPNNWNTFSKRAPLNFSQSFSVGNQGKLFNRTIGFIAGFRYGSSIQYDPNSISQRTILSDLDSDGNPLTDQRINQQFVKYTNGWSALINVAYKYSLNHSISLLFMPNFTGINNIRDGVDVNENFIYYYTFTKSQFYEQRKQMVYQLKSEHYFPKPRLKVDLHSSYSRGKSSAPDFKNLEYYADRNLAYQFDKTLGSVRRDYRYLSENIFDSKLFAEFPINEKSGLARKIKFGGAFQNINKKFDQFDYFLKLNNGASYEIPNNDLDQYFSIDKFDIQTNSLNGNHQSIDLFYERFDGPSNHTIGHSNIAAAFILLDYALFPALRVSGGVRAEKTEIFTDVFKYDSLGYKKNDPRRRPPGESFVVNPGSISRINYLPSINIIYKLRNNELAPINLRLNYSKTIARPSIREYSETIVRDYELNADVFGNADLKMVEINNYDLRLESFFKSSESVSISFFYKDFKNHIEQVNSNIGFTWTNAEKSRVLGIELEGKMKITKRLEFRANVSFVDSRSEIIEKQLSVSNGIRTWYPTDTVTRKMFGQAPFVINGILSYSLDSIGLVTTLSYNVQGARLVLTSTDGAPDVYEMPRHLLDFKVSKKIGKHFNVSLTVRDILNSPIKRSYKYDEGYLLDFDSYRYGTNFILGISYKL